MNKTLFRVKRIGNLFKSICELDNLKLADKKASKSKAAQRGVILHRRNQEDNIHKLRESLLTKKFTTSKYHVFRLYDPKEREIHRLPYYPDRIVHHAILNILEPVFTRSFTADTYSCIKGRGIHKSSYKLRRVIKSKPYCLKVDIRKFYENIDHDILKGLLRRKFKDNDLLWLLDDIIDSTSGIPIGNYLSQFFANFYLSGFDHWIKEVKKVECYFRYCDDLVMLGEKEELGLLLEDIKDYMAQLKLQLKPNHRIFPIKQGIDFVGYVHYPTHTLLRKSIKKRYIKMMKHNRNRKSIASYNGWLSHANCINLKRKYERK